MPKNDNAHSLRMVESLKKNISSDVANEFAEKYPLSKSADIVKKFQWAQATCNYLEENFDEETIVKVSLQIKSQG